MKDIVDQLAAIHREVAREPGDPDEVVRVTLRREYPTTAEDLWSALTEPDRMSRWFMPITGDLKVGGSFQLEGNAGGDILDCDPPTRFRTTFGGESSLVTVTLRPAGDSATELTLDHTVPVAMAGSIAGALFVGPGWDGGLLGLYLHVTGHADGDPVAAATSPEAVDVTHRSLLAWIDVVAAGDVTPDELEAVREAAMAQYPPAQTG
jgi:uncharacterized protein YndB with AHSA1/START domain